VDIFFLVGLIVFYGLRCLNGDVKPCGTTMGILMYCGRCMSGI
jgi:hypothetical protein